ncbi:MAG: sensor histidine kinase [Anaerolineales bacterium]|nr:sensor histidine kinase [Anaerolineales bacterium]
MDSIKTENSLWITAYLTLIAVAVGTLLARTADQPFWPILGIYVLIGAEMAFQDRFTTIPGVFFYISLLTMTTSSLYFFNVEPGLYLVIFFVISAQAMMMLPRPWGAVWILVLAGISALTFTMKEGIQSALMLMLIYGGGYLFFGIFGRVMLDSRLATERSEKLYAELQTAHAQLQDSIQRMEELAVTKERNRLAREMHDSIGHRLTVSAVQLEGAQRLVSKNPEKAEDMIGTVREEVKNALSELRQTVTALRQPIEIDLPLNQSLERLASSFETVSGLDIQLALSTLPPLSDQYRHIIYRTVQEGLTNIQRHAKATIAWIYLTQSLDKISLIISDNGKGFPPDPISNGYGMRGITERVALVGGECKFEEHTSGGAQITIYLPLERETTDE